MTDDVRELRRNMCERRGDCQSRAAATAPTDLAAGTITITITITLTLTITITGIAAGPVAQPPSSEGRQPTQCPMNYSGAACWC